MTTYHQPLQRQRDKRWDFTSSTGSSDAYAIGYCAGGDGQYFGGGGSSDKYHSDGHKTAGEACDCYREYELDTKLKFYTAESEQHRCQVCSEWTQGFAQLGDRRPLYLCSAHQTRDEVAKLAK